MADIVSGCLGPGAGLVCLLIFRALADMAYGPIWAWHRTITSVDARHILLGTSAPLPSPPLPLPQTPTHGRARAHGGWGKRGGGGCHLCCFEGISSRRQPLTRPDVAQQLRGHDPAPIKDQLVDCNPPVMQ